MTNTKNPWFWVRYVLLRALPAAMLAEAVICLTMPLKERLMAGGAEMLLSTVIPVSYNLTFLSLAAAGVLRPFERCRQAVRVLWIAAAALAAANVAALILDAFLSLWEGGFISYSSLIGAVPVSPPVTAAIAVAAFLLLRRSPHARVAWIVAVVLTVLAAGVIPLITDLLDQLVDSRLSIMELTDLPPALYWRDMLLDPALFILPVVTGLRPAKE